VSRKIPIDVTQAGPLYPQPEKTEDFNLDGRGQKIAAMPEVRRVAVLGVTQTGA
jgi:hypothetical protein